MTSSINLDNISDEELLKVHINNLPVKIEGTWLQECVQQLYKELEDKGIIFKPECYLADEWLTPEYETCIGIPFFLAHPALIHLERKFMMEAEGETKDWCMKLLRHEAGHAIFYAYQFYKQKQWEDLFGPSTLEYTDRYKYRAYSKNYVRHLDGYYAQYHPEEDFVETFAVWLTPHYDWQVRYKGWGAIKKLKYVDELMSNIKDKMPAVKSHRKFYRLSTLRMTLKNYYKKKRLLLAEEFPDFHDAFLRRVFVVRNEENKGLPSAAQVIHKYSRTILNSVTKFSGEKKYIISDLFKDVEKRSRELKLVVTTDEVSVVTNLSTYITSLIMNYLHTGQFRGDSKKKK